MENVTWLNKKGEQKTDYSLIVVIVGVCFLLIMSINLVGGLINYNIKAQTFCEKEFGYDSEYKANRNGPYCSYNVNGYVGTQKIIEHKKGFLKIK